MMDGDELALLGKVFQDAQGSSYVPRQNSQPCSVVVPAYSSKSGLLGWVR